MYWPVGLFQITTYPIQGWLPARGPVESSWWARESRLKVPPARCWKTLEGHWPMGFPPKTCRNSGKPPKSVYLGSQQEAQLDQLPRSRQLQHQTRISFVSRPPLLTDIWGISMHIAYLRLWLLNLWLLWLLKDA